MKKLIVLSIVVIVMFLATTACTPELIGADGGLKMDENLFEDNQVDSTDSPHVEEWGVLYRFQEDGLWGFKDAYGEVVVEPQYSYVHDFSEGLAFVRGTEDRDYLTGFMDSTGKLVIPRPNVIMATRFSEGFVTIIEREWDLGNDETSFDFKWLETHWVELDVSEPGPFIYIDRAGENIFGREFYHAHPFSEGLAFVRGIGDRGYMTGFISLTGELVIPLPNIILGGSFFEGFAAITEREWDWANEDPLIVGTPGPRIFIDRTGENIFGLEFASVDRFIDGFARVSLFDGSQRYIDRYGNFFTSRP